MADILRRNRKSTDRQITRLNALGFSLSGVSKKLQCHPTSVSLRLKSLNVEPSDTRQAFMDTVYKAMPEEYQEDLADLLEGNGQQIKDYVQSLIEADVKARRASVTQTGSSQNV